MESHAYVNSERQHLLTQKIIPLHYGARPPALGIIFRAAEEAVQKGKFRAKKGECESLEKVSRAHLFESGAPGAASTQQSMILNARDQMFSAIRLTPFLGSATQTAPTDGRRRRRHLGSGVDTATERRRVKSHFA